MLLNSLGHFCESSTLSFQSTNPTSTVDKLSGLVSKLGGASMYRKYIKIFIGASVFLFAASELKQYMYISDQYLMPCSIANGMICVVLVYTIQ